MSIEMNIDGIWRPLSSISKVIVRLYVYGNLYQEHIVNEKENFSLPTVLPVQADDVAHIGWSTVYGGSSATYTDSFVPTKDINLYAVFSYRVMVTITKQAGYSLIEGYFPEQAVTSFPVTIEVAGTISYRAGNVTQASIPGVGHKTGSAGVALQGTADTGGLFTNASISVNGKNLTGVFEDGSDSLTYAVSVGDVIGAGGYEESSTSENSYGPFTIYYKPVITVTYPALQEQIKYRSSI